VTVSVGFTEIVDGDLPGVAFERADRAVCCAKSHGRNQVQNCTALIARGKLESDAELF
jgi:PleD family two-component response regulator